MASTGRLDFSPLGSYVARSLSAQLDPLVGTRSLIIDPSLAGPLGLVTHLAALTRNGLDQLFWLEQGSLGHAANARNIVWLARPQLATLRLLASQLLSIPNRSSLVLTILLAPRVPQLSRILLADAGVLGDVDLRHFDLSFVPLASDLFSLEEAHAAYPQIFSVGSLSPIYNMAQSIMTFQRAYGLIPRIVGKGVAARKLATLLHQLRADYVASPGHGSSMPKLSPGSIDSLVILDRQVDMVTPMCTQLTYEGLLDEIFGIEHAHIQVAPDLLAPSTPVAGNTAHSIPSSSTSQTFPHTCQRKKHLLCSSSDPLFAQLRDQNFSMVGNCLNRIAKRINTDYERRNDARTVQQIREFVGKLAGLQNEHQALRLHTGLSEQIMTTTNSEEFNAVLEIQQNLVAGLDLSGQERAISSLIDQELPLRTVLRLLCLYSLVCGGLKNKVFENLERDILQTYGYEHLNLLINLSSLSLLSPASSLSSTSSARMKGTGNLTTTTAPMSIVSGMMMGVGNRSSFVSARRPLKLISDEVNEADPNDITYTYSGYAPLSVRLVESAVFGDQGRIGWKGSAVAEVLKGFPGDTFDEKQTVDDPDHSTLSCAEFGFSSSPSSPPTTLVCFLGGITYGEVAALRFMFEKKYPPSPSSHDRDKLKSGGAGGGRGVGGRNLVILTTGMVNGNGILSSLMPGGGC